MELIIKMLITLALYDVLGWGLVLILGIIFKDSKPSSPRKSFKERLAEKQWESAKHHGLHQPDNKADTSNPPKETGT